MFDIGWSELILIGVFALIFVGPKDLPDMFRQIGRFTAKARSMARDFSRAMEDVAKEAGVDDVARDLRKTTSPSALGLDAVKNAATKFENWDPMRSVNNISKPKPAAPPPPPPPPPTPKVEKPAPRPLPQPVRRRKIEDAQTARRAVPRKPAKKQ